MKDLLFPTGILILLSIISSLLLTWIKKGQFEKWGIKVGKLLSYLGNKELGKEQWEKIEDILTLAILSFAKGIKIGADNDDRINDNLINGTKYKKGIKK